MTPVAPMISTLEQYLKLTTTREQAIAANMANVDTPGYHTHDINFQGELHKAMNNAMSNAMNSAMNNAGAEDEGAATNSGMNPALNPALNPVVQEVSGLLERPDGNNVSLDREGLLLAETQLQYQIGIQLVKHHFHGLLSAINGGN